jgi:hypothetical protein
MTSDDNVQTHKCDWHNCEENHLAAVDYADQVGDVKQSGGDNKDVCEDNHYTPWGIGAYGMKAKDQRKYGFNRPQWSYPGDEDYFLEAKKKNIVDKIQKNRFKQSDLPAEIVAIINDPTVGGEELIAIGDHQVKPQVARFLGTRNCVPYRDKYADWSEAKRRREGVPRIMTEYSYPCEAHHLLSKQFFGGQLGGDYTDLNENAKLVGYNVDGLENAIMLPRFVVDVVCHGLPQHEGNHNATDYNQSVGKILKTAQKWSLKRCQSNIQGGEPTSQRRLVARLHRASRVVRQHIMEWHRGYELRPDNRGAREDAYKRIKLMLLFDDIERGYPNVPVGEVYLG